MGDSRKLGDIVTDKKLVVLLTNVSPEDGGTGPRAPEFDEDDFVKDIKVRLGDHASELSKVNKQRILPGSTEISTQLPNGFPSPIQSGDTIEGDSFTKTLAETPQGREAVQAFNNSSENDLLTIKVKKGIEIGSGGQVDYTENILADVNTNGGDSAIAKDVSRAISENSRFSGDNPYFDANADPTESNSGTKDFYQQSELGVNNPRKWPVASGYDKKPVTIQDMKNLGIQVLLEGSGERNVPKEYDRPFDLSTAMGNAVVPGFARIGQRVPYGRFNSGRIMEQVNDSFVSKEEVLSDGDALSFGSPWNPLVRFNSLNSASSRIVVSLLSLTISGMVIALSKAVHNSSFSDLPQIKDALEPYNEIRMSRMGSYDGQASFELGPSKTRISYRHDTSYLLSVKTQHDYTECIKKGVQVFFDLPDNAIVAVGASLVNSFRDSLEANTSYGYYLTLLRAIVRDTTDVFVDGIAGAATSTTNVDLSTRGSLEVNNRIDTPDNPYGIIEAIEVFLRRLRQSKLLGFMDVLANIGDLALIKQDSLDDNVNRFGSIVDSINDEDSEIYNNIKQSVLQKKSRLKNGKLSWGSNTVASMYILPGPFESAERDIVGTANARLSTKLGKRMGFVRAGASTRIDSEKSKEIERILDAVYVPFYFHDLRTNEIISFHAFLENITDGYSANYEKQGGIGRVGGTSTYRDTERTIGFSFKVISTNPSDFDEMWFKVNKLVSMVYPQYTAGRSVTDPSGNKFIQPFSQLISSSPLVRVRIGDLIKSNLSQFDVARTFGAGTNSFNFSTQNQEAYRENQRRLNEDTNRVRDTEASIRKRMTDLESDNAGLQTGDVLVLSTPLFVARSQKNNRAKRLGSNRTSAMETLKLLPSKRRGNSTIEIPKGAKLMVTEVMSQRQKRYTLMLSGIHAGLNEVQNASFELDLSLISVSSYRPDDNFVLHSARRQIARQSEGPVADQDSFENIENVTKFFSPNGANGNPITRAFATTAGKGLAGFINSINFDWEEYLWETEGENSVAPQGMNIDISFSPIHDINPGLASDGFMIGAPYNIGQIMKAFHDLKIGGTDNESAVTNKKTGDGQ